ncbi:MAG: branched-chain amino acid ABC transporter permease [Rhodospirillum sp.]|jgi:branched-chain amino acid transport system permease protein|nr:branched-chain amino acid ABC transporter permease [Rhodospirillum sp.]
MTVLSEFLQHMANGLVLGFLYALVGIGLSMVYGILRMINFAHGEILMVGVFLALPISALGAPAWLVLLTGIAGATFMGLLVQWAIYRPLLKSPEVTLLVASLGVSLLLQNLVLMLTSPQPKRPAPAPFLDQPFQVGEIVLRNVDLAIIVIAIAATLATHLFLKHTRHGRALRALAQDMSAARMMGVNVPFMVMVCFLIGSALAGVAGVLIGYKYGHLTPLSGFVPGLKGFVAAVIGGIGSFPGAVVGGLILGLLETFLVGYLPDALAQYRDAYVFLVLILVLLVKPSGLFGKPETVKV